MDLVAEYLRLGLRFDRLEEGFVDAFTGDPALRRLVENEPKPNPRALHAKAQELLAALPSSGLPADRAAFLAGQLGGLAVSARKFAGEQVGFVDEVTAYFQVRPELGDEDQYAEVHAELGRLLPGDGTLTERYAAYRRRDECPPAKLEGVVEVLNSALRDLARSGYGLPEQETVEYQIVTDKPWSGFNYYLGGYHSRVAINADLPHRLAHLPHLVAHESYPGHHTEHCRKERGLVRRAGQDEQRIFLVNTPQCLLAEGLADLGLRATIGTGWGPWAAQIYADLGLGFEGEMVERVTAAVGGLDRVRQDAALLLHDRGRDPDEIVAYLTRWLLVGEDRARQSLRFLSHPLWRAYTSTYVEGYRLLSAWLDARPAGQPVADRFVRLLDEPLTPAGVAAELDPEPRVGTVPA
ncbi:MAG TPA: DUF885 domain-containing protein [Mycobacteriales bacterium]|nr:DUF885 domain-containing protein [Mycobacteriales bacterium]